MKNTELKQGTNKKKIDNMDSPEGRLLSYLIALGVFVVLFPRGCDALKGLGVTGTA